MPFKDPDKRKSKAREYAKKYTQKQKQVPGICSVAGCQNSTTDKRKKCESHLEYMREYKKKYRQKKNPVGICSNSDCMFAARPSFKLCDRCNERSKAKQKQPRVRAQITARSKEIKSEVFAAYGGTCLCCGETHPDFLSIDHTNGYDGQSPRKGSQLYRWLLRNRFPDDFRVLCMSCNFALGHHGYCPHSNLTQVCRAGRPTDREVNPPARERRRLYWLSYKLDIFAAYGGACCTCCGETHHECLSIDHINDDGPAHRKELTGNPRDGRNLYIWLRQNEFPTGFQVLCMNCNFAKGHFGICPHQRSVTQCLGT